jgi:hypothetical protein
VPDAHKHPQFLWITLWATVFSPCQSLDFPGLATGCRKMRRCFFHENQTLGTIFLLYDRGGARCGGACAAVDILAQLLGLRWPGRLIRHGDAP